MNWKITDKELTWLKGEYGSLPADFLNILNRYKSYLCQLLNAHEVSGVRYTEQNAYVLAIS